MGKVSKKKRKLGRKQLKQEPRRTREKEPGMSEEMRVALEQAKAKLQEQQEFIEKIMAQPTPYASVLRMTRTRRGDPRVVLLSDGKCVEVETPSDKTLVAKLKPGKLVRIVGQSFAITDVVEDDDGTGEVCRVLTVTNERVCEIEYNGSRRTVAYGSVKVEESDRVVIDRSGTLVLANLGKEDERFNFDACTNVSWDDIGGLEEAKAAMVEAVEMPTRHSAMYARYNKKPIKGVLLYGPPGCGKTMLAKAAATSLASLHGKSAAGGFVYVKGPEILNQFVGNSEANVRALFESAREHKKKHGYPAVIFIDEADAILGRRGSRPFMGMESTIVPMFLSEMDGLDDSGAMVLLATNRASALDPAVVREGRIDRKVKVTRPGEKDAAHILRLHLANKPVNGDVSDFAAAGAEAVFKDDRVLYRVSRNSEPPVNFTLGHIVNGAMLAAVVDSATSIAMRREIAGGKPKGVTRDDLAAAVDQILRANRDVSHDDDLAEFIEPFRDDVAHIRKVKATGDIGAAVAAPAAE